MNGGDTAGTTTQRAAQTRVSVAALQAEIRTQFMNMPVHRALGQILKSIGIYFGAEYAAVHARLGVHTLSEEWCRDPDSLADEHRESANECMLQAMGAGASKCFRVRQPDGDEQTILGAAMLDEELEQAGAMSMILSDCSRDRAIEVLGIIEGIAGYMALMVSADIIASPEGSRTFDPAAFSIEGSKASDHPVHLALTMANELRNSFGLGLVAVGFVHATRVKVVAISGLDEVRAANPGVRLIRAAMEECFDRRETVLSSSFPGDEVIEDDCRLHREWRESVGGDPVGSFPLFLQDEIIAIVSVTNSLPNGLPPEFVRILATDMAKYGPILPLCRYATRGVTAHVFETLRQAKDKLLGTGRRRTLTKALILAGLVAWLLFGSLTYSITVPCRVRAAVQRIVSSPRDGVLADLFVRPGDRVQAGQLIALLDDQDDVLARHEIKAELATLDALIDKALEDGDSGTMRIHEAQKRTMSARLAVVEHDIQLAQIRAPQAGIILDGDLREKLGSRVATGESLFTLAGYNRIAVELHIPEHLILDARKNQAVWFVPSGRPGERIALDHPRFSPAGTVQDGVNVFLAESTLTVPLRELPPGMEGFAHLEVGPRRVWWVLSHRVINWFRLRFWV